MASEEKSGYVYILTNPAFREDWVKIGKSSRPVESRLKELDNTSIPLPFEIYATLRSTKYDLVESLVHKQIDLLSDKRIRPNREFFNMTPADALNLLREVAVILDDAEIAIYVDGRPKISENKEQDKDITESNDKKRIHQTPFKFHMIGLTRGDEILFEPTKTKVIVESDDRIKYDGQIWSLSAFTAEYMPEERRNNSNSYQGPKYFSYNETTLDVLRKQLSKE